MKNLFAILIIIFPLFTSGQITDDFNDGDFTNNPTWSGDVANWQVLNQQLGVNGPAITPTTTYLSLPSTFVNNTEWDFFVNPKCATSSGNLMDIYLISNNSDLTIADGYFVRIGGTPDEVSLFVTSGGTATKIIDGTDATISSSSNNPTKIRVVRTSANDWTLDADFTGTGTSYTTQGTVNDATFLASSWFGVKVTYSASNNQKYFFDDLSIANLSPDVTPPVLVSASATSSMQVDLAFSETVDQATAETVTNYNVNNGLGAPSSAVRDLSNFSLVHLNYATAFTNGLQNTLTVNNVQDLSSNIILANSTINFTYNQVVPPAPYDIVINEFMADPDPQVGLPNAEFVELFNRSTKTINLSGWTFSDASTTTSAIGNITVLPGGYVIVCSSSNQTVFAVFGTTIGLSSFPSLNNTGGETLTLTDNNGNTIDQVYYDETYYHDPAKDGGGFTIERIDPDFSCSNSLNWKASNDNSGGTPGKINSVDGSFTDNISPGATQVYPVNSSTVNVFFSEPIDNNAAGNSTFYSIDHGIGNPFSVIPAGNKVTLSFSQVMQVGIIYHLTLNNQLKDCSGNLLTGNLVIPLGVPEEPDSNSILINEILFNPETGGFDFVELYNNSTKIIDLLPLNIANVDPVTREINDSYSITTEGYILFPGEYIALTENPAAVQSQYSLSNIKNYLTIPSLPSFNDDEGGAAIVDPSLKKLDQLIYSDKWHFPLLNDNEGVSLERISFNRPTQDQSNWHSASETVGFATPGYKNSQVSDSNGDGSEVNVGPELFSPDNDGYHDILNIHYKFDSPGYTANLTIYDSDGREIRKLVRNELLGTNDGTFSWDGINEDHEKGRAGIYVLYFEAFSENGEVKKFKKPFVLATKL